MRRDTDAMIWMMLAMYTMLVVVAVNVVQKAFGTWRNYGELAAEEQEEMRLTPAQRMRIKEKAWQCKLLVQRVVRDADAS